MILRPSPSRDVFTLNGTTTVPEADKAGMKGVAYNAAADQRSWRSMLRLFGEVFTAPK